MWEGFEVVGKHLYRTRHAGCIIIGSRTSKGTWTLMWLGPGGIILDFDTEEEAWGYVTTNGLVAPAADSVIHSRDTNMPRRHSTMSELVMRKQKPKGRTNTAAKYDYAKIVREIQGDGSGDEFLIVEDSEDFNTIYTALTKHGLKVITEATSKPKEMPQRKNVYARMMTPAEEKAAAERADVRAAKAKAAKDRADAPAPAAQADAEVATLEDAVSEAAESFKEPASS